MKIAVTAESTVDMPKELLDKYDVKTLPFTVTLGENNLLDGEVSADEIIAYVNNSKTLPKTSAVNKTQYDSFFDELLTEYDGVIHFSLSSELSSAYNNAVASANERKKVFVVDSRSLSTGIALLCIYARKLADDGEDLQTIYNKCMKRIPKVQASFVLSRVDYLYRGGRCSVLSYLGANILKIKPQILVKNGKMVSGKKYRGKFVGVIETYCKNVLAEFDTPDLSEVFLTYTTATQEELDVAYKYLVDAGFTNIHVTRANGTITSHCGENCLGILYINDGKMRTENLHSNKPKRIK